MKPRALLWLAAAVVMFFSVYCGVTNYAVLYAQPGFDLYGHGQDRANAVNLAIIGGGMAGAFALWRAYVNVRSPE